MTFSTVLLILLLLLQLTAVNLYCYYYSLYNHYNNTNIITTLGYLYFILILLTLHLVYRARSSEKSNKYIIKPPKASDNFFHSLFLPFEGLVYVFPRMQVLITPLYTHTYTERGKEYYYTFILFIHSDKPVRDARARV